MNIQFLPVYDPGSIGFMSCWSKLYIFHDIQ